MNAKAKIWKYTWNAAGYDPEEFHLNVSENAVGDVIRLPRSYFRTDKFAAYALINDKYVALNCVPYGAPTKTADLIFVGRDADLSRLAGTDIYGKIKLSSKRVLVANLKIIVSAVADTLDDSSFNQDLHQNAEVAHKSLTVKKLVSDTAKIDLLKAESVDGFGGVLSKDQVTLAAPRIILGDTLEISDKKVTFHTDGFSTSNGGELRFDTNTRRWKAFNEPLLTFVGDYGTTEFGVSVSLGNPTGVTFVPWLTIEPSTHTLVVEKLRIGACTLTEEELVQLKALLSK